MRSKWLLASLPLLTIFAACAQQEPWAETDLSRTAAEWRPPKGSTSVPKDLDTLEQHLKVISAKPNLYDLHDSRGALATFSEINAALALRILGATKLPIEIDEATGVFSHNGEPRRLSLDLDKTVVKLPHARTRQSLPHQIGLIAVADNGQIRVTTGDHLSMPIPPSDIHVFTGSWRNKHGVDAPATPPSETEAPIQALVIRLSPSGAITVDGDSVSVEDLANQLNAALNQEDRPLLLLPSSEASYGDVVAILDQIHLIATERGVRVARPSLAHRKLHGDGGRAIPVKQRHLTAPVMTLKVDVTTPYRNIDRVLTSVAEHCEHVVLLTHLDTSDRASITLETWPGGLPGGMILPLAAATGTVIAAAEPHTYRGPIDAPEAPAEPPPEEPLHVGGDVQAPEKLVAPQAEFTEIARKAKIQGVVIVQAVINTEGNVQKVKVLKGLPMGLSESAVKTIRTWKFKPATLHGEPVTVYYNLTMNFRLGS